MLNGTLEKVVGWKLKLGLELDESSCMVNARLANARLEARVSFMMRGLAIRRFDRTGCKGWTRFDV